ncbi:hypothetical protein BP6252_00005 [Coleophoma cylindrospora]|uniref:Major facilitator superfamily (MFS) profile domain-containing protein n=1 Tax=Coleophoma cylindrospora TaxID=1849047 RepID=A0A3D8SNR5_9HELO|nr:hypothetical protein BP6252_00005 [Coleophoma cylindrospora]
MPLIPISKLGSKTAYVVILLAALASLADVAADSAVINNLTLLDGYVEFYNLDAALLGLNVAITSVGYVIAGPFSGDILDRIGRVKAMMVGSILTIVSVAISGSAPVEAAFVVGRFLLGVSMAISATASTLYVAELAPPQHRQTLIGILIGLSGFIVTFFTLSVLGLYGLRTMWAWRGFVLSELIAPLIGLVLLLFAPETPRWLISKGRTDEALEILAVLHAKGDRNNELVKLEFQEICATIDAEKSVHSSWKGLLTPAPNLRRFGICLLSSIFYQMLGAGNLLYFMSILLQNLGIQSMKNIILINWGLGIWNTCAMMFGGWFLDRVGRKSTLVYSTIIMSICMLVIGLLQRQLEFGVTLGLSVGAVITIFIYQFVASMGWQILAYSYPNEILAFSQRAKGSALTQSVGYAFSFVYLYCFPIALETIAWKFFVLNSCWSLAFAVVIWFVFVETKGKTLEEIDELFEGNGAVTMGIHPHQDLEDSLSEVGSSNLNDKIIAQTTVDGTIKDNKVTGL